ncbi:MAG TPA: iron ABC transporter permease [Thermoplasmata archaeon]|nr:iron ABC transporter permease [Thermoplasmata archaeon]
MNQRRVGALALGGAALGLLVTSPLVGNVPIPADAVFQILLHQLTGGVLYPDPCSGTSASPRLCNAWVEIIWDSRLPAILLALIAGAALGISGGTLQGTFRNPLADPYLLGLSAGGTLGAAVLFVFQVGLADANLFLPLFAFVGAVLTGGAILVAARVLGSSVETLLLTGVALASMLSAVLSILLLYNPTGSLQVSFWLLGGLGGATWNRDGIAFGGALIAGVGLSLYARELNLLQLGSDVAHSLGVESEKVRRRLLLYSSLGTGTAVAFTGIIGFVGLVSPHIVRRLIGPDYRYVLPGSALVGGFFLLAANDLAVGAFPASVLPVGIFTSFAGAPFFLYLLYRRRFQRAGDAV